MGLRRKKKGGADGVQPSLCTLDEKSSLLCHMQLPKLWWAPDWGQGLYCRAHEAGMAQALPWWRSKLMLQSVPFLDLSAWDEGIGLFHSWASIQDNQQPWDKQKQWTILPTPIGRNCEHRVWLLPLAFPQISLPCATKEPWNFPNKPCPFRNQQWGAGKC